MTQKSKLDVGHLKREHLAMFPTCLTAFHGFDEILSETELWIWSALFKWSSINVSA